MFSRSKNPNVQSFKKIHDFKIFTKKSKANPLRKFFQKKKLLIFMVILALEAYKNFLWLISSKPGGPGFDSQAGQASLCMSVF